MKSSLSLSLASCSLAAFAQAGSPAPEVAQTLPQPPLQQLRLRRQLLTSRS